MYGLENVSIVGGADKFCQKQKLSNDFGIFNESDISQ